MGAKALPNFSIYIRSDTMLTLAFSWRSGNDSYGNRTCTPYSAFKQNIPLNQLEILLLISNNLIYISYNFGILFQKRLLRESNPHPLLCIQAKYIIESVVNFALNIKQLNISYNFGTPKKITLDPPLSLIFPSCKWA